MQGKTVIFKALSAITCFLSVQLTLQAQRPVPAPYPSTIKINSVKTWDAVKPGLNGSTITTQTLKDVKQGTQYFDALGRPLQTVVRQGSIATGGAATDIVSMAEYDSLGREIFTYLPFASTANDGAFKINPFQNQKDFYDDVNGVLKGQGESWYYSQLNIEISPLNRVQKTMSAGNNWVGAGRGVEAKYFANTATDDVKKWNVTDVTNGWGTFSVAGAYPAGELVKTISVDEHGKQVIEFKDKQGKVILKKVQLTATADDGTGKDYTGWLCTYYIYDNLNSLRCVIQPEGVKTLQVAGWPSPSNGGGWGAVLDEQCFRYEYDLRNRMIRKKVPGADEVWMVYDARDRLVMTQDANMREARQWMYTTYDSYNRPVATGLLTDDINYRNLSYHLGLAYNSVSYPNLGSYTTDELTRTFYDDYSWRSSWGNPLSAAFNTSYNSYFETGYSTWPYPVAPAQSSAIKGMVTGTRIKVLGTGTYLFTVSFYDDRGRLIQVQAQNITGGTDIMTTQYTFSGLPLVTVSKTEKTAPNAQTTVTVTKTTYDDLLRVVKTEKKLSNTLVNGGAMSVYTTIVQNEYDKLGQLKKKKAGNKPGAASGTPLVNLDYEYNIRGWLLSVNKDYITAGSNNDQYFGMQLGYDKNGSLGTFAPQYNGNIGGTIWKSEGDQQKRKYDFTYDATNRLTTADFNQYVSGSGTSAVFNKSAGLDFTESMNYDDNGNITSLVRYGLDFANSTRIDVLSYSYTGNRLEQVIDEADVPKANLGDFRDNDNKEKDYAYDVNGNLIQDGNKAIERIRYNHLNLPSEITVTDKGTITYTYDAAGNKLKKTVMEGSSTKITTYLAGAVYEASSPVGGGPVGADELQFVMHEEGRIRFKASNNTLHYDYFVKDHLGNVRMVLTEEQQTDAYPPASMETAQSATEESFYSNLPATRVNKPAGYPNDTYTNPNDKVAKVSGSGNKIGPAMILKVMAGDKFNLRVNSWWNSGATPGTPISPLNDLVNALSDGVASVSGGKATASDLTSSGLSNSAASGFLSSQTYNSAKPKAYVNWIFLDEQFKYYAGGFDQVDASNVFKTHLYNDVAITKSGYLYIYVSNETPNIDVFFDNLQVTHIRGRILEETHYYPFGLTMAGISSKALAFGGAENKKKFNGIEQNKDFDLNMYDAFYRNLDPQIGRFWEIDPKIESAEAWSPYSAMLDNPIRYADPMGDSAIKPTWYPPMSNPSTSGNNSSFNPFAPVMYQGYANVKAEAVRVQYNKDAAKLNPSDKQGRVDLKEKTRVNTPEPFKTAIEQSRPMAGEQAKVNDPNFKGNATKTNVEVNETAKVTGVLGKTFLVAGIVQSSVTIANSPTPVKETVTEGAGWGMALYGGSQGAAFGTSVGGPVGGVIFGAVGSTAGFFLGKKGADAVVQFGPALSAGARDFYDYNERARRGDVDQNGMPLPVVCFIKGTLIYSQQGEASIENIKVGDTVYSYNTDKSKVELSRVVNTLNREVQEVYEIKAGNETINATAEHPFYVIGKGWVKTKDLKAGYVLKSADNKTMVSVGAIQVLNRAVTVYNIEVDGNHNYFVTKSFILVHNKNISEIKEEEKK